MTSGSSAPIGPISEQPVLDETGSLEKFVYNDSIVRAFLMITVLWGVVALLVGLVIALELVLPTLGMGLPYLSFGRLRPLHTNAAIFAFAGNAIFAAVYHSTQRLCKCRIFSDFLSWFHFWGWQLIIVAAAVTLPLGYTQSKEYAELEWPIDLAIAVVWVAFAVNFFGTLARRRERHMYVALWFYIATIIAITVLHVFNSLELPVGPLKSYPVYAGVQDAFIQWWYGHNAVGFLLTTPFLGIMYYYLPKAAQRPVYSYRLSIVHFWSLVFIYIWAGPHHLHYSALPEWASTLGMLFSVMLWMPSWGGMLNGLLTLRGAWNKVAADPILKFFVVAITFYGMSTFEGPMLSIKEVNALGHYTDWIIAHVHSGTLGWVGFMTFGMLYWLMPRMFQAPLWSKKLMNAHFWIATIGILVYIVPVYVAGLTQGLMWRALDPKGGLRYEFLQTVVVLMPMYWLRAAGGTLYLAGMLLCVVNLLKTWSARPAQYAEQVHERRHWREVCRTAGSRVASEGRRGDRTGPLARRLAARLVAPPRRTAALAVYDLGGLRRGRRLAVRGHSPVPHPVERAHHRRGQALFAAGTAGTRHLHRKRLLQLPFADDPPHFGRDEALRRIQQAGRIGL